MNSFERYSQAYFVGIGGIGMSALARYFRHAGLDVAGYDKTRSSLTDELVDEGIQVTFSEDAAAIPGTFRAVENRSRTLVVTTPAVPATHDGLCWFRENGFAIHKRAEVLGRITEGHPTVAVAGTHGKTTTSSMVAHLLHACGIRTTAFLGGISKNFGSNLLLAGAVTDPASVMVVEADEYDRSFLQLHPDVAVVTSMDPDHLDIFGDEGHMREAFAQFAGQTVPGGTVIQRAGLDLDPGPHKKYTYSLTRQADFGARNIDVRDGRYRFDLTWGDRVVEALALSLPGRHNLENAVAALAVALQFGVADENLRQALAGYQGVVRRFDFLIRDPLITFVDDYAHHPAELRACITALREWFPGRRLTGVFQPHLYSRTRDFADAFAESLSLLDELILLDIYPAREDPIPGVTASLILDKVGLEAKMLCRREELLDAIGRLNPEVLVTMGAGDIDRLVEPIADMLRKKHGL